MVRVPLGMKARFVVTWQKAHNLADSAMNLDEIEIAIEWSTGHQKRFRRHGKITIAVSIIALLVSLCYFSVSTSLLIAVVIAVVVFVVLTETSEPLCWYHYGRLADDFWHDLWVLNAELGEEVRPDWDWPEYRNAVSRKVQSYAEKVLYWESSKIQEEILDAPTQRIRAKQALERLCQVAQPFGLTLGKSVTDCLKEAMSKETVLDAERPHLPPIAAT